MQQAKKIEITLTNVARASLEELLLDYEDFLRQRNFCIWDKDDLKSQTMRKRLQEDKINLPSRNDNKPQLTGLNDLCEFIKVCQPEIAANAILCLINQASYLLGKQIKRLEEDFMNTGGFTERLYNKRKYAKRKE
ncbi:MAG: four helix bundle suffix domain-containing protein [Sedimentisphaeraceae bacterium JB056]